MQIHSTVGKISTYKSTNTGYSELDRQFCKSGFTYKSNEILHKISENFPKSYPYEVLLHIAKTFHFNQFETIFFSHILNDVEPCYNNEPELFNDDIEVSPAVAKIIDLVLNNANQYKSYNNHSHHQQMTVIVRNNRQSDIKKQFNDFEGEDNNNRFYFTHSEIKKIYAYLLVLGYAVKYYLNQQIVIKPYDEEIKMRHPTFFASIFNRWAKKYGNSVLATTPRRINSYYLNLASQLQVEENSNNQNNDTDCQYRNYNEIVEELIKATTQGEDIGEMEKDIHDNQ